MSDVEQDQSKTSRLRTGRRLAIGTLGIIVALVAGRWIYPVLAAEFGSPPTETIIPRGRLHQSLSNGQKASEEGSCQIPALPEGPGRADIELRADAAHAAVGGAIEPARYRIIAAYASQAGFTPGRWSMTFDLADSGQGAFYRQLGFDRQSSRIHWSMRNGVFSYETVCPDSGERMEFPYSTRDGKLFMTAPDAIVLVLEPYGPSEVRELPELP